MSERPNIDDICAKFLRRRQRPGERLEAVVKRADLAMFEQKRAHYARDMDELLRATSVA